jgi:hypothetical protein
MPCPRQCSTFGTNWRMPESHGSPVFDTNLRAGMQKLTQNSTSAFGSCMDGACGASYQRSSHPNEQTFTSKACYNKGSAGRSYTAGLPGKCYSAQIAGQIGE